MNAGREVPIPGGGRLTGRAGTFTLDRAEHPDRRRADDRAPSTGFSVARIKRDVLRRSSVGAIFTHRSESVLSPGGNRTRLRSRRHVCVLRQSVDQRLLGQDQTTGVDRDDSSTAASSATTGIGPASRRSTSSSTGCSPPIGFVRRRDMRQERGLSALQPRPEVNRGGTGKFSWGTEFDSVDERRGSSGRARRKAVRNRFENSDRFQFLIQPHLRFSEAAIAIAPTSSSPSGGFGLPQHPGGDYNLRLGSAVVSGNVVGRARHVLR